MKKLIPLLMMLLAYPDAGLAGETAQPPQTLLQIAGVRQPLATLADSVLLIIDAQREYSDGKLPLSGIDSAIGETAQLLKQARQAGTPVIHVVHKAKPGSPLFDPQNQFVEIVPQLLPAPGENVIVKTLPNAFTGTGLEKHLAGLGRKNLLFTGFMTHNCVSATVRAALDLGYRSTVIAAATAERDLPDGNGGIVSAAALQRAELAALSDRTATVVARAADIPLH